MWKTVLRRTLIMIPQLFILSIFVFVLAKFMPGDPFSGMISPQTPPARLEELREKAGLNDPLPTQYVRWLKNAAHGDFGKSYTMKMPVNRVIGARAQNTFWLALLSMILMYAIALPLGIIAGRKSGTKVDQAINLYNFLTLSIPGFVMYLVSLLIFGYRLKWFPTGGTVSISAGTGLSYIGSRLYHMLLPALSYALIATTGTVQYLRNEIIDAKTQDYVRTARAKGVPTKKVYSHHIFRNSLLPIAAFFGFQITGLLGGSVMIETVFAYPGMGSLFIESITSRDYSVITTLVLLYGLLTLMGSLLSDIIMTIVDPRIRID